MEGGRTRCREPRAPGEGGEPSRDAPRTRNSGLPSNAPELSRPSSAQPSRASGPKPPLTSPRARRPTLARRPLRRPAAPPRAPRARRRGPVCWTKPRTPADPGSHAAPPRTRPCVPHATRGPRRPSIFQALDSPRTKAPPAEKDGASGSQGCRGEWRGPESERPGPDAKGAPAPLPPRALLPAAHPCGSGKQPPPARWARPQRLGSSRDAASAPTLPFARPFSPAPPTPQAPHKAGARPLPHDRDGD